MQAKLGAHFRQHVLKGSASVSGYVNKLVTLDLLVRDKNFERFLSKDDLAPFSFPPHTLHCTFGRHIRRSGSKESLSSM